MASSARCRPSAHPSQGTESRPRPPALQRGKGAHCARSPKTRTRTPVATAARPPTKRRRFVLSFLLRRRPSDEALCATIERIKVAPPILTEVTYIMASEARTLARGFALQDAPVQLLRPLDEAPRAAQQHAHTTRGITRAIALQDLPLQTFPSWNLKVLQGLRVLELVASHPASLTPAPLSIEDNIGTTNQASIAPLSLACDAVPQRYRAHASRVGDYLQPPPMLRCTISGAHLLRHYLLLVPCIGSEP